MNRYLTYSIEHIFKSKKFYAGLLMFLFIHSIFRSLTNKFFGHGFGDEIAWSKAVTSIVYGISYVICLISLISLKFKVSKLFLNTWIIISSIAILNELIYYLRSPNYSLIESINSGQIYISIKITLSILFCGIWQTLNSSSKLLKNILIFILYVTIINSICIWFGAIFELKIFQSYPGSSRWGYSGFLSRGYASFFAYLSLANLFFNEKRNYYTTPLLFSSLLLIGTKVGILYFGLIFFFFKLKSKRTRAMLIALGALLSISINYWIEYVLNYSAFWKNVYNENGVYGVLFSLRNQDFIRVVQQINESYSVKDFLIGGKFRYEFLWVEMIALDYFVFYGFIGLVVFIYYYKSLIPSWKYSVPLLIALFSGTLISPLMCIIWICWCLQEVNKNLLRRG